MAIWVNGPPEAVARSILKPLSMPELSVQLSLIREASTVVAARLLGAEGVEDVPLIRFMKCVQFQ